jgi:hypothetical protein
MVMSDNELLDPILPSLADGFEAHKSNFAGIEVKPLPGEWEALRELLAHQFAAGLILYIGTGKPSWIVKLTQPGYTTHWPRIQALRAIGTVRTT